MTPSQKTMDGFLYYKKINFYQGLRRIQDEIMIIAKTDFYLLKRVE